MKMHKNIGFKMSKLLEDNGGSNWWKTEWEYAWDDLVMLKGGD